MPERTPAQADILAASARAQDDWHDVPCGRCGTPADIICTSIDGGTTGIRGDGHTMALCTQHFWDWNGASLQRRGFSYLGGQLRDMATRPEFTGRQKS